MNPLLLYASGGALLVGLTSGWVIRDWKADADLLAEKDRVEQVRIEMQAKVDSKADEYEDLRANLEPGKVETRNTIREIYRNVEVPAECAAGADVVGVLSDVRLRVNSLATGELSPAVPRDNAASEAVD
jgi:hypothetical protein